LLLQTFDISTFDALKVCVWCILHGTGVYKCMSSRHTGSTSIAHLLLAEIYGTQSTNYHLHLKMMEISTFDALKVCVWCILYETGGISIHLKQTQSAKKQCTLATGRDIQYTVNKLSLALKDD
jgi:tryptophan-rich sensory protein